MAKKDIHIDSLNLRLPQSYEPHAHSIAKEIAENLSREFSGKKRQKAFQTLNIRLKSNNETTAAQLSRQVTDAILKGIS